MTPPTASEPSSRRGALANGTDATDDDATDDDALTGAPALAADATFADLLAHPGVEEQVHLGSRIGLLAFHGGNLERATDVIAERVAHRTGASLYVVRQPHPLRHHIASSRVVRDHSPRLDAFLDHVEVAIALHGYGREGRWTDLLVGGSNRAFASTVGDALRRALPAFTIVDDAAALPSDLAGMHPHNPVNQPRHGGVQLELPPRVRGLTPHAATMARVDGLIAWTHALVDALCEAVHAWEPPGDARPPVRRTGRRPGATPR